jgi:multidrug efflux pump subunit AcrB
VGVFDIEDNLELGKLEARLELLPSARALGLTTAGLATELRASIFGVEAQRIQRGADEVRVYVRLPENQRRRISDLERFRISTPAGPRVPLGEVARLGTGRGYSSIFRQDQVRAVRVRADVDEGLGNVSEITADLGASLVDIGDLFGGVSITFKGRKKETRESMGSLKVGFPVALALVYAIIAILFRSYLQPLMVMSVLPFAGVGALVGHVIMGFPVTLLSMIGLVALVGIVVNDSLILVNSVNVRRRDGAELFTAILEAGQLRLRPILLTSITTILGLTPMMLEQSFQAQFLIPLAISIVYGVAFATFIVLLLIPCLYLVLEDFFRVGRWIWNG